MVERENREILTKVANALLALDEGPVKERMKYELALKIREIVKERHSKVKGGARPRIQTILVTPKEFSNLRHQDDSK